MRFQLSSVHPVSPEVFWEELQYPRSFLYVSAPLVRFAPHPDHPLPERWVPGRYLVTMYLFGFLPLGEQWIAISLDAGKKKLHDQGHSRLISTWDHRIALEPAGAGQTRYTDTVEVGAGWLTPLVFAFARVFFWWRQRRWTRFWQDRQPVGDA